MKYDLEHIEQLIIDRLAGVLSPEDELYLARAIETEPVVATLWQDYALSLTIYQQTGTSWNKEAAWSAIHSAIGKAKQIATPVKHLKHKPARTRIVLWVSTAAACLLVAIGTLWFVFNKKTTAPASHTGTTMELTMANGKKIQLRKGDGTISTEEAEFIADSTAMQFAGKEGVKDTAFNTLYIPQGLNYALTLSDGSRVWLNAATEIKFPLYFPSYARVVELKGEAYFEVTTDPVHPFIVKTPEMDVQVHGTSFNIKAYPDETVQASLLEGKIEARTTNTKHTLMLVPGKAAVLTAGGTLQETAFDEKVTFSWRKGYYYFQNESIASINAAVHRWFGYRFQYKQADIAQIRWSGALDKKESLSSFLDRVAASANLAYTIQDNEVILERSAK